MREKLLRSSFEDLLPTDQKIGSLSYLEGPPRILFHEDDGQTQVTRQGLYGLQHFRSDLRRKVCGGFVEHDGLGFSYHGYRDRDHLPLTSAQVEDLGAHVQIG